MHGGSKIYLKIEVGLFWRKMDVRITEFGGIGERRLVRMCWVTTSEVLPIILSKRAALLGTACLGMKGVSGH